MRVLSPMLCCLALAGPLGCPSASGTTSSEESAPNRIRFNIPAAKAEVSLNRFADQAGLPLIYLLHQVEGIQLNAVEGNHHPSTAIQRLVENTELNAIRDEDSGTWVIRPRNGGSTAINNINGSTKPEYPHAMEENKSLINKAFTGLLSVLLLGGTPEAFSQESTESGSTIRELDQFEVSEEAYTGYVGSVTVSGARTQMNLVDVPQTINIITGDVIEDMGSDDPQDAIVRAAPGASTFGPPTGPNIMIRGFRAQNWAVDGATSRYRIGLTNFNWDAIEVIKGPSSLMYGPFGAYGGYVNLVAKKPKRNPVNKVQVGLGTDSHVRTMLDVGHVWGSDGKWQSRFVAGFLSEDFAGPYDSFREGWIIAPSVAIDLNENSRLTLRYSYEKLEQTEVRTAFNAAGELADGFNFRNKNREPARVADSQMYQMTLTSRFSDQWSSRVNLYGQFEDYQYNLPLLLGNNPSDTYAFRLDERFADQWTVYGDFAVSWTLNDLPNGLSNEFTFGAEINHWDLTRHYWALSNQYPAFANATVDVTDPQWWTDPQIPSPDDLTYSNRSLLYNREWLGAAFFQENFSLMNGKLTFSYGGRWNYDNRSNFEVFREPNTPDGELVARPGSPAPTQVNQEWTWRYGAVYKPLPNLSVYYGHTEAYLPVGAIFKVDGSRLEPETGANDEIGVKFDLIEALGGQWSGSLAFFSLEVTNKWRGDPDNPTFFIQDGLQTNDGFEASLTYSNEKVTLMGGYYRADGPIEPGNNNARAVYSPDRTVNFWGKYNLNDRFSFGGGYRGIGDTISNNRVYTVEAYDSIDLFATYTMPLHDGQLRLHAIASNIEDDNSISRINNASSIFINEGLRLKLTATYTW